jgi:mersacidin/lichenicidin family type 2 lantibiotic
MTMPVTEIVRSWTDEEFRAGLTPDQRGLLPDHPAGTIEAELEPQLGAFDPASRAECPATTFSRNPCCF